MTWIHVCILLASHAFLPFAQLLLVCCGKLRLVLFLFVDTNSRLAVTTDYHHRYASLAALAAYAVRRAVAYCDPAFVVALSCVVFPLLPSSHVVDIGLFLAER